MEEVPMLLSVDSATLTTMVLEIKMLTSVLTIANKSAYHTSLK